MKRYLLLIIFLVDCIFTFGQSIYFQFSNGSTVTYAATDVRKVTHSGSTLNLSLTNGSSFSYNIDDIVYYNYEPVPMILSGAISVPEYDSLCVGSASSPASFSIQGFRMTGNVQVTAPSGFEVSATENSGYASSLTISPSSGRINSTLYVRFLPNQSDATIGFKTFNGLITHASSGASERTTGVFGTSIVTGAYKGPSTGNWGDAANWCGGIPTMNTDVLIPDGKTVELNVNGNTKSLNMLNTATLKGGSSMLSVYGNWTNAGTFLPQTGTIAFRGASEDVTIHDDFYNLTVNKSSGSVIINDHITISNNLSLLSDSLIIAPGYRLELPGSANFGGQRVIVRSDAGGTASIGILGNNGLNLTGASNVTVERYIPAKRAWRLLTAPLIGNSINSIYDNWQNTGSGTGVTIFSPSGTGAAGNGIINGGISSSILTYNSPANAWDAITNTKTNLLFDVTKGSNKSYALFVTGPAGGPVSGTAQPTILKPTGTLQTGTVTFSGLTANQFHLIGNPYASPVKLNTVLNTVGDNTNNAVYVWDAKGTNLGKYKVWDPTLKWSVGGAPSGDNYGNDVIIQSGQAFFIRASSTSNASITFTEADKVNNQANNVTFRTGSIHQLMRIELGRVVNEKAVFSDASAVLFDASYAVEVDDHDIAKFPNMEDNIAVLRNNKTLVIERRPVWTVTDTVYLRTSNLAQTTYQLGVSFENLSIPAGSVIVLQDLADGTEKTISPMQTNAFTFSVNSSNLSIQDRFRIIFRNSMITQVINPEKRKSFTIYPNPVAKGSPLQIDLSNKKAGIYDVSLYTISGIRIQQNQIRHLGGQSLQSLTLDKLIPAGAYIIEIVNEKGDREQMKLNIQ